MHTPAIITIDGALCTDKQTTFEVFAASLSFPDYFGYNWDAFEEIINDSLPEHQNTKVILYNHEQLLADYPEEKAILTDILQMANEQQTYQFYHATLF